MAKVTDTSRYGMLMAQREKRRAIVEQGMARMDNIRSYLSANINKNAALQVQTTEMTLRSKAQAAAAAKSKALVNKLA